ncbi:MAG: UvrD-helicase domain-containing protein [Aquabacterium sp.]
MSQAAYEVNGHLVDPAHFYEVACDPRRSVVVEACAGAGKTWMLVSRILRALLDGVPPNQILAITFTKKAAGEMRERLHTWLRDFAHASDAQREQELRMRGVQEAALAEMAPRLQQLYAQWLEEGKGVDIHTIHGWFSRLVKAAPLDVLHELGLPPELNLVEDTAEYWPELWGRFLRRIDAQAQARASHKTQADGAPATPQAKDADAFMAIVREVGRFNTEAWLQSALSNRLELSLADQAGLLDEGVESAGEWQLQWAGLDCPSQALLRESVRTHFATLARLLAKSKGKKAQDAGMAVEKALSLPDAMQQAQALCAALLTKDGEPRKQLGDLEDLAWAQAWLMDLDRALLQEAAHRLHAQMVRLSRILFEEYAALKTERGLADMVDLELAAARLLGDPVLSGWIQERLDSQVRQLLMDEFQDTSPLQWQTLKSWLSAYAGAGGGMSGRQPVQVFLVGDPKQSIYRFRRADPRVFTAAKDFVIEALGGALLACDHTRRNAPGVIEVLNKVMQQAHDEGSFPGFRPHTTASQAEASVRVLPSIPRSAAVKPEMVEGWRDSLFTPREQARTSIKEMEAAQVADAIASLMQEEGLAASDIFVLSRRRATLSMVAQALDAHGLPHIAPEDTLLIDTPEVRDLVAVVDALVSPHHDLALAHALKSPLFGATDEELLWLSARTKRQDAAHSTSWWEALSALNGDAREQQAPESLARAARLLSRWAQMVKTAPPHDLLTAIVTQGDFRQRLLASVPPSQRAQALCHVDALLAQTLEMDAGRDATPYRWVRMLKRLPLALPPRAQPQAIQLLTIHGAKGLEARAVFMVDTDPEPARKDSYALMVDWPESDERPRRCAFIRSQGKPPPSLAQTLADDLAADQREELNALYVALTRAREQLVFSRTEPRTTNAGSWWQRLVASAAIDPHRLWLPQPSQAAKDQDAPPDAVLMALPVLTAGTTPAAPAMRMPDDVSVQQLLGQVVHRVLEWLTPLPVAQRTAPQLERAVKAAAAEVGLDAAHHAQAAHLADTILRSPELQSWLDPAHVDWAGNEVSLFDQGQVLRIDRLVARLAPQGRQWWVLDYKLAHRPEALAGYRQQLLRYVAAVSALQPGEKVSAGFITSAGAYVPLDDGQPA